MIPPGLLPENSEPRRSPSSWVLPVVVLAALLALAGAGFQIRRLAKERDQAVADLETALRKPPPAPATILPGDPPAKPAPEPPSTAPTPAPPAPTRAPDVRVLPSKALDPQHVAQGMQEFRAGRYDQAERQFFRAFPDSVLYLALTSLALARWQESVGFLARAMAIDPDWLRKVKPADLFGSKAEYDRVVRVLEEQLEKDPVNPDLKTLLAYLRYHDKGAPYAKALLIEATNAQPEHEAAKAFLEALGP